MITSYSQLLIEGGRGELGAEALLCVDFIERGARQMRNLLANLLTYMATIPPYWGPWFSIWKNRLGDPDTEAGRVFLAERSPINHLERATRPILIAQGMQDVRVVAAESEQMVTALKNRRVPGIVSSHCTVHPAAASRSASRSRSAAPIRIAG